MVDLFGTTLSSDDFTTAGVVAAAVLAVLLVALSTYGRRRFSHPAVRLVVLGASTVYLALVSSVISSLQRKSTTEKDCDGTPPLSGRQNPNVQNMWTLCAHPHHQTPTRVGNMELFGTTVSSDDFTTWGVAAAAVLAVLLVALSTSSRRRFSHPAVRLVVLGASTVYLALMSSVISSLQRKSTTKNCDGTQPPSGGQNPDIRDMWTLLLWIVLILTIKGNADAAAAAAGATAALPASGDVSIDGQRIKTCTGPVELLVQYGLVAYLIIFCLPQAKWLGPSNVCIFIVFSGLGLAKTVLKLVVSFRASGSFALGKNARLVAGYMAQLVADGDDGLEPVPRYIVMGESEKHVEESPDGYRVKRDVMEEEAEVEEDRFSGLVTLDRVWRMAASGDGVFAVTDDGELRLRDLCLSYSLFKILRRRLSGYPLADAGSRESLDFVLRGMDGVGGAADNAGRVFRVLVHELSFASDFYYSPIPLSTFNGWCAAVNCACSVLIIALAVAVGCFYDKDVVRYTAYKIVTYFLLLAVMVVEAWEIAGGVSSNWTKMTLLGHYIRHPSLWRRFGWVHAALAAVLRLRPARRWRDKIGQNSVLEPRRLRTRSGASWLLSLFTERFYGRAGLMRSVEVEPAVKNAVLRSLRSSYGIPSNGGAAARRVGGGNWAWDGSSSNTDMILAWHIATTLFEMRSRTTPASKWDRVAACHLSNYCAYLVAAAPELLPDCTAWTTKRYKKVSEDVRAALGTRDGGGGGESAARRYERLVQALSAPSRDAVVRRGAELVGRELVERFGEEEALAWRMLADLWAEMVLHVAPSENVKGHVEAMARGGEFVTLVWALLLHAGVTTRPDAPGAAIP
ncbi:hypothetical protein ACP4OV_020716 [Aristida adscensionis]